MRILTILALSIVLSGCATTQPAGVQAPSALVVPQGKAKLTITMNDDMSLMQVPARVDLNGNRVAELRQGESYSAAIEPGKVILATYAWFTPGTFVSHFELEANREYHFEIAPRAAHLEAPSFLGAKGTVRDGSVDVNGGPYAIALKETKLLQATASTNLPAPIDAAARAPSPPAKADAPTPALTSKESRLYELKGFHEKGLISEAIYLEKQREILGSGQ